MTDVHLLRRLGFKESFAIVVGSIIGTGVFLKTAVMAQDAGSPLYVLLAWVTAGVLSYIGALIYAELSCLFPAAGGEYVFLREAYGPLTGFLFGWIRFWIASPGSIAAYAIGAVTFLDSVLPMTSHRRLEMAIAIIGFFTLLNCFSVQFGGAVQTAMTAVKILMIFGLAASILTFGAGTGWHHLSDAASSVGWKSWSGFGLAVLGALWAFDGWNNLSMAAGEVRDPDRAIPQSLAWGLIAVLFSPSRFHIKPSRAIAKGTRAPVKIVPFIASELVLAEFERLALEDAIQKVEVECRTAQRPFMTWDPYGMRWDGPESSRTSRCGGRRPCAPRTMCMSPSATKTIS
jgi:amino acid transporter